MPDSSPDRQGPIFGAVLGVVGLILVAGIVFITMRKRQRGQQRDTEKASGSFHGTAVLDKEHPAAKIVPFGTSAEDHYSRHPPGASMRLAIRRPDGAWDFTDPNDPFTPSGISDIHISPVSPTTSPTSNKGSSKSAVMEYKEQESTVSRMIRLGYDARDSDLALTEGPLPHPPPAYGQEPTTPRATPRSPRSPSSPSSTRNTSRRY